MIKFFYEAKNLQQNLYTQIYWNRHDNMKCLIVYFDVLRPLYF